MKNSNYTIGNRTRDLPACSAVSLFEHVGTDIKVPHVVAMCTKALKHVADCHCVLVILLMTSHGWRQVQLGRRLRLRRLQRISYLYRYAFPPLNAKLKFIRQTIPASAACTLLQASVCSSTSILPLAKHAHLHGNTHLIILHQYGSCFPMLAHVTYSRSWQRNRRC
jgi:hypothetical protein